MKYLLYISLAVIFTLTGFQAQAQSRLSFNIPGCPSSEPDGNGDDDPNSVELISSTDEIRLFPNPVQSNVTVSTPEHTAITQIEIVSLTGALIQSLSGNFSGDFNLNLSSLSSGVYFIRLQSPTRRYTEKFIKN